MSLGFEQAGFDVVASLDIDPVHCAVHAFNFPLCSVLCRDITQTSGAEIRVKAGIEDSDVDVVFGGPPCQGFSMMGKRALDDPRNALVFHFMRIVHELRPKYFVMENVAGLTTGKHRRFLQELIDDFKKHGFDVEPDYKVLNAAEYGVPQNRKRLFLIGCRKGLSWPKYPRSLTQPKKEPRNRQTEIELLRLKSPSPTVLEAIGDLPEVENHSELLERDWTQAKFGKPSQYAGYLRQTSIDPEDFSHPRRFEKNILTSSLRTQHTPKSIKRFNQTKHGDTEPISRFYKLDPDGLCNTLRAGTASDRGAFTSPRPIHPFTPRCITVREAARLHSYPDWFRLHATKWHGFRQVGNSVPPLLARAVAKEIRIALGVKPIKPAKTLELGNERLLSMNMSEAAEHFGVSRTVIAPRTRGEQKVAHG